MNPFNCSICSFLPRSYVGRNFLHWNIGFDQWAPISGRYYAIRFGVTMNTSTEEGIMNMIYQREQPHGLV